VIKDVHAANYGVYGVRKVHAEVNRQGHRAARCTVARLMRAAGLRGISRAKGPRTTPGHSHTRHALMNILVNAHVKGGRVSLDRTQSRRSPSANEKE
jgi:transposase InsO family protein